MRSRNLCSIAFEDFSQSLRVLAEAHMRARAGLLRVDRAEAVGNIETSLGSVLNALHSFRDAIEKEFDTRPIDWYSSPELATVLAIRNARHHNKANRIRTLYTYHVHEAKKPIDLEPYVLIDFPSPEGDADTLDLYLSWSDFDALLSLPASESRLPESSCRAIREYLDTDSFRRHARRFRLGKRRLFFNVTPLIVNAGAVIVPLVRDQVSPLSPESEYFLDHFVMVSSVITKRHEVHKTRFFLPG